MDKRAFAVALLSAGLIASACSSSSGGTSPTGGGTTPPTSRTVKLTPSAFTSDFSVMSQLRSIAAAGKGKVGVILPDLMSSPRYSEFDAPYLTRAFQQAGVASSDISVQNALGSDSTFITDAKTLVDDGAAVLVIDPQDAATGSRVAQYANQHGVKVIDYDRITHGSYYVTFNNLKAGALMANGLKRCALAWGVSSPQLIEMLGDPTGSNASQFKRGFESVATANPSWHVTPQPAGRWNPVKALRVFQQAYTAHTVNSTIIPNDANGVAIINFLKSHGAKPRSFPVVAQEATLSGLQNVLAGWQCGTVYRPLYAEAQAAAVVALYVRAHRTPPASLVNATTKNPNDRTIAIPTVSLPPRWVTRKNMNDTVVKDQFVSAGQLCAPAYIKACRKAGIR